MTLERGTHLDSYEILAPLGSGGMGDVYRAKDRRLGRDVAIKVLELEPGVGSDTERHKRFEQEARAASALNHPNIVTIYDIGEHEGTHYIAMEYVEGRTLRELLAEGLLPRTRFSTSRNKPWKASPRPTKPASFIGTSSPRTSW